MSDPGGPLGVNPNMRFNPTTGGLKSALRDTGIAALEMGSAGLAPGYAAAEQLATEMTGEEGFMAQGMHQDQARRNEELAIVVGAMVKSGHLPVDQAITLMESLPKSGSAEDFSLKSAFALGAQMGASAAPIASFVQSLVTTSAQAAAQRAAGKGFEAQKIRDSRGNVYDSEGEFPPTVPDPLRPVSPRNPDFPTLRNQAAGGMMDDAAGAGKSELYGGFSTARDHEIFKSIQSAQSAVRKKVLMGLSDVQLQKLDMDAVDDLVSSAVQKRIDSAKGLIKPTEWTGWLNEGIDDMAKSVKLPRGLMPGGVSPKLPKAPSRRK